MNNLSIAHSLFLVGILSGCSLGATPSESDIKSNLDKIFKNCDYFELANVKKINTYPTEQNSVTVAEFSFDLKITPTSTSSEIRDQYKKDIGLFKEVEIRQKDNEKKIQDMLKGLSSFERESPEYYEAHSAITKERARLYEEINVKMNELHKSGLKYTNAHSAWSHIRFDMQKKCNFSNFSGRVLYDITVPSEEKMMEKFGSGEIIKEISYKIPMIKTENGWVFKI